MNSGPTFRGRAGSTSRAVATLAVSGLLLAQSPVPEPPDFSAWLRQPTPAAAEAMLQDCLAKLAPAQRGDYLRDVGSTLQDQPIALPGAAGRRCVQAHHGLLAACASNDARTVEWFSWAAAHFLVGANDDPEGALTTLAEVEQLVPQAVDLLFSRRGLEVDCRTLLQQLAAADRLVGELRNLAKSPLERVEVLVRQGSLDVMLGRLDLATRRLDAAARSLAAIAPADDVEVRDAQFQLLLHQLELLKANEQFAAVQKVIARFVAEREHDGAALDEDQQLELQLHETAAEYLASQHDSARIGAAIAAIDLLLGSPRLGARARNLAVVWQADLALRTNHLDRATTLLDQSDATTLRGNRWLAAAVHAELARRSAADRATLLRHESVLRAILHDMIAEWHAVAWDGESTGFLRLGLRLRILGELIAITSTLHGPERALADVLEVQCCTAVSRARGATVLPLAELRARVFADDAGALVFVPAWNASHVFAFDRSRFVHRVLPRASELRARARALRVELLALDEESVPVDALSRLQAANRQLAGTLLPTEVRQLMAHWHHVTITGGNLLGSPAFACLPWDDDTLLGERFAVATIASLPLLAKLHAEAEAPAPFAAVPVRLFATLTPAAAFIARNRLTTLGTLAGPEWERLLGQLPGTAATCVGPAATVTAWRRANDAQPRLTVLMAHGEQPSDGGAPSFGLTSDDEHPDGLLTPAGIRASRQAGLVVLAACHAARGELRMGDDDVADSLAGAFLFAGATSVVASAAPLRARLHTAAGAALLTALATGADASEALRQARLAVGGNDLAERLRVGQLELIGHGTMPVVAPPERSSPWPWVLAGTLVALIMGTWTCARRHRRRWPCPAPG